MADIAFSRIEMLPPEAPPASEIGAVGWARANLFSSWLNAILTVLSVAAVAWVVLHIWPWFAHSVWNANSLAECRQIIAERWGEGAGGACFAVIHQRWHQFLFGFYPQHLYWRPTLAFVLMLVALAPVLFSDVPRKLLWFSIIFPGVAYWLLWGGSLLLPIAIYAGFARRLALPSAHRALRLEPGLHARRGRRHPDLVVLPRRPGGARRRRRTTV